ncbi:unnamed protein product [Ectocarpus sp. CCAP 1310/34]|nr:unnamed protein product [Ectocarpus sp. CCAP 1310/34]
MPSVAPPKQSPRGNRNELHDAADNDIIAEILALVCGGSVDIDQGDPHGWTPLMIATAQGHSRTVRVLLDVGADASMVGENGATALIIAAQRGHLEAAEMLVEAGAYLEAVTPQGFTPLHLAAYEGYPEVMRALISAGAEVNSRLPNGTTPLYTAALRGKMESIKELLRANADPLLARTTPTGNFPPLAAAAERGRVGAVRELIRQLGIEKFGAAGGLEALRLAAKDGHVDQQQQQQQQRQEEKSIATSAYVNNARDALGRTPLLGSIDIGIIKPCFPRIVRLLVDSGADTKSAVRYTYRDGLVGFSDTPLYRTIRILRDVETEGKDDNEKQLGRLEAVRRLLLRVEAVHATSWVWPSSAAASVAQDAAEVIAGAKTESTRLRSMMQILRRRATRRGVLLRALSRYSSSETDVPCEPSRGIFS